MKTSRQKIYWDANIFLAWLNNEPQAADVEEGIKETVRLVHSNRIILFTSVVTQTEILQSKLSSDAQKKFSDLFKRKNVKLIAIDQRISERAGYIRDYYDQKGTKLSVPDCQHLATAIIYEADEMQTLDGSGKRSRPNDLIRLNGNVAGYPLTIVKPAIKQSSFGF